MEIKPQDNQNKRSSISKNMADILPCLSTRNLNTNTNIVAKKLLEIDSNASKKLPLGLEFDLGGTSRVLKNEKYSFAGKIKKQDFFYQSDIGKPQTKY